jgi:hypothetical protein
VLSTRRWTPTRVILRSGELIGIKASGLIKVGTDQHWGPAGDQSCIPNHDYPAANPAFPAPKLPCWSLIARIGNGRPFAVGAAKLLPVSSGRLYLGVNSRDFWDSSGKWTVNIKIGGYPPQPL